MIEISLLQPQREQDLWGRLKDAYTGVNSYRVGLDIASDAVRACVMRSVRGGLRVVRYIEAPLPPEAIVDGALMNSECIVGELAEIRRTLEAEGIPKHARVSFGVCGHSVIIKKISFPTMTEKELCEAIPWEAEQYIPFDIQDVWIDTQILNPHVKEQGQMEVLLVAAKRDMIADYAAVIEKSGFVPAVVDVDCFALENAFTTLYPKSSDGKTIVLLNIGASMLNINILANGVTAFTRDISMGADLHTEEIQKQLNISYDEASVLLLQACGAALEGDAVVTAEVRRIVKAVNDTVAGEIQRSLDFYSATTVNYHIDRIFCSGPYASIPGLTKVIEKRSGVPVEVPELVTNAQAVIPGSSLSPARFMISYGLALRDVEKARRVRSIALKEDDRKTRGGGDRRRNADHRARREDGRIPVKKYQPSQKEMAQFCDRFAILLKHGAPLIDAFGVLALPDALMGSGKRFRGAVAVICNLLKEGATLADAMEKAFSGIPVVIMVIRVGEVRGTLGDVLADIADHLRTKK